MCPHERRALPRRNLLHDREELHHLTQVPEGKRRIHCLGEGFLDRLVAEAQRLASVQALFGGSQRLAVPPLRSEQSSSAHSEGTEVLNVGGIPQLRNELERHP